MKLLISVFIMAAALALMVGCGSTSAGKTSGSKPGATPTAVTAGKTPAPPAAAPETNRVHQIVVGSEVRGEITSVNLAARFVVLNFPVGVLPAKGMALGVFRQGVKTGEIQVSGPHRDTFTVADILKGDCRPGDEVRP